MLKFKHAVKCFAELVPGCLVHKLKSPNNAKRLPADIPVLRPRTFSRALEKRSMPGRLANLGCGWIKKENEFLN